MRWLRWLSNPDRSHMRDAGITLVVLGAVIAGLWFREPSAPARRPGPAVAGNAFDFVEQLGSPIADLQTRYSRLPGILQYAEYTPPAGTWTPAHLSKFLEYQVLTKVARTDAEFDLLEGKRTEALRRLAALHYLGELMSRDGLSGPGMIGTALQAISLGGLENTVLNISETTDSRRLAWQTLEDLDARTVPPTRRHTAAKAPLLQRLLASQSIDEMLARRQTVYAKLQLLRAAVAALDCLASSGHFPRSAPEFAPFLPSGLPADPFLKRSAPLQFASMGKDLVLWSLGPDQADQRGAVLYDPTNGAVSAGDVVVEVRHDRKYPFPTSGTVVTASDLRTRFSRGLPPDPFADTRGRSYNLTTTGPLTVYSFGPDTDDSSHASLGIPEVQYDPTNGIVSEGDLVRVLAE